MTKTFFDTNLWLRFILMDNNKQFKEVKSLLEVNEGGLIRIYSSPVIFLELAYVLKSVYKFMFDEVQDVLNSTRHTKQMTVLPEDDLDLALKYFNKYKIKFSDCLVASQIKNEISLVTFDTDFNKIKEIKTQSPAQLLASIKYN